MAREDLGKGMLEDESCLVPAGLCLIEGRLVDLGIWAEVE